MRWRRKKWLEYRYYSFILGLIVIRIIEIGKSSFGRRKKNVLGIKNGGSKIQK
jgi:hypothetical protein